MNFKKPEIMNINEFENLLLGTWELENGGPIVHLEEDRKMKVEGNNSDEQTFMLEDEDGVLILTIPGVIQNSEVIIISPTELVVKEFKQGSAESKVRTFRRLPE